MIVPSAVRVLQFVGQVRSKKKFIGGLGGNLKKPQEKTFFNWTGKSNQTDSKHRLKNVRNNLDQVNMNNVWKLETEHETVGWDSPTPSILCHFLD